MSQPSEPADRRRLTIGSTGDPRAAHRRSAPCRVDEDVVIRFALRHRPHLPITARGLAGFNDYGDRGGRR